MSCAAAVFVKTPGRSAVKTRLATRIGRDAAERLHLACAHAVAAVLRSCADVLVPHYAVAEADALSAWDDLAVVDQGEGSLGERLHHVHAGLQRSHGRVLLLGADAPQLTPRLLREAAAALCDRDPCIVFGPAVDGGFWLFGGNRALPRALWTSVPYSSAGTGQALLAALARTAPGCRQVHLRPLRDLDTFGDIVPVLAALDALPDPLPAQRRVAAMLRPFAPGDGS